MAGNSARPRMVLQERDLRLLRELHAMRIVDREQAALVGRFGSVTRVNARLLALARAGFLRRVAVGTERGGHKYLYALTRSGARVVALPYADVPLTPHNVIAGQPFLEHQLRLNAVYLRLKHHAIPLSDAGCERWQTFTKPLAANLPLVPDAYIELRTANGIVPIFLEIDRGTESLRVWRGKVEQYVSLAVSGTFARMFSQPQFRVLVIVPSDRRLATLRAGIARATTKIFWLTTTAACDAPGFWDSIWYRPTGDDPRPLI
jgi:hypothetical protein